MPSNYGAFGYKIYKNGALLGFTTKTVYGYTMIPGEDPNGNYRITAAYQNVGACESAGVVVSIHYEEPVNYDLSLVASPNKTYQLNAELASNDVTPGVHDIKLLRNGVAVTPTVSVTITDGSGNKVSAISTLEAKEYTITYRVTHEKYDKTITRKVIIKE